MHRILLRPLLCLAIVGVVSAAAFAQVRGRGVGRGRGGDVFSDRDFRGNRGRSHNWKCGKFVNCHDARDGRIDGRGPRRTTGSWRNGNFVARGSNVGFRNRYSTNDYWRRRHLNQVRYRSRTWRY